MFQLEGFCFGDVVSSGSSSDLGDDVEASDVWVVGTRYVWSSDLDVSFDWFIQNYLIENDWSAASCWQNDGLSLTCLAQRLRLCELIRIGSISTPPEHA